jgi:hypothetical protein
MLCDISKALKVKGELDPNFIGNMVAGNDLWAIKYKYHGAFHDETTSEKLVEETNKILNAWRDITFSVKALADKDRDALEGGADSYKFPGFDGNEPGHYGVASILLNQLGLFRELADEPLNSHSNNIQMHRNLVANLNDWGSDGFGKRSKQQIEEATTAR